MNTKKHLSTRQHQFLQRAGMLSFAALLLGVGTASAQQNHFLPPVSEPSWLDTPAVSFCYSAKAVDIDGDSDLDLFLGNSEFYNSSISFMKNEGSATQPNFVTQSSNLDLGAILPVGGFDFGDLDNDGDLDVLFIDFGYPQVDTVKYIANTGTSTLPNFTNAPTVLFAMPTNVYSYIISLADMDNDGDLDLLTYDNYSHHYYYANTGSSSVSFDTAQANPFSLPIRTSNVFNQLSFIDMDNDGDLDVWQNYTAPAIGVNYLENTGLNAFSTAQYYPMSLDSVSGNSRTFASGMAVLDVNDDGDNDIIVPSLRNFFENTKCDTNNTAPVVTQSSNTISTGAGLSSYQWYSVDAQGVRTPVQGATSATFAPTTDGSYTVRAKKTNGCVAYSADFAFVHIGVNSVADANLWNVSPNPVTSELFVQSDLTWLRWEIIDAQGRVIRTIAKPTTNSINVSELPQGIYTLRGQAADGKSAISRFVKK